MANTIIQLKNSGIPGNVPSILQPGELAINYTDGKLFYGNSINVATLFDAITEPSGLNGEIQFNNSGVFGASANLKYDTGTKTLSTDNILASVDITGNKLISNNSSGDEGGEILLAKSVTNTTLDGVGITIDSYQNRIRFFEQGGSARGAYIDLTQAAGGVGTNLLGASSDEFARLQANSAFNTANSATTTAQAGFNTANSATTTAQAGFDKANTANIQYTASNTAPTSPAPKLGDKWYKIDSDILYTYSTDGGPYNFWLDISSAKITSNAASAPQNITGDLVVSGNVIGGNLVTSNAVTSGTLAVSSSANIGTDLGVTGNVTASYFIGDGSQLTGITTGGGGGSVNVYSNSYVLTATTTNSTETEAYINGVAGTRIPVNTNKTIYYTADLACRRTDSTGDHAAWYIKGVATNASGTVTDIGSLYEIIVARTDASMAVDFRADDANNSLGVYLTGSTGKTVSWSCVVNVLEV
jgi:hypothetical protein